MESFEIKCKWGSVKAQGKLSVSIVFIVCFGFMTYFPDAAAYLNFILPNAK